MGIFKNKKEEKAPMDGNEILDDIMSVDKEDEFEECSNLEAQTTFNEDSMDDLLEGCEVENVYNQN